jgi:hypothetical protein
MPQMRLPCNKSIDGFLPMILIFVVFVPAHSPAAEKGQRP